MFLLVFWLQILLLCMHAALKAHGLTHKVVQKTVVAFLITDIRALQMHHGVVLSSEEKI